MSETDPLLVRLAGAARDRSVGGILEAMASAIDAGAEVQAEPELRDAEGRVRRSGPLELPSRGDLAVTRKARTLVRKVESGPAPAGRSIAIVAGGGFVAEIAPFRWDEATLTVYSKQPEPNWTPLRRWFLEWFQSRHCEVSPELLGAVHSLEGPQRAGHGWTFVADFGSAPVGCLTDLMAALAQSGAVRMQVG